MNVIVVTCELFYSKVFLQQLRQTPEMTWNAGVSERFKQFTKEEIKEFFSRGIRECKIETQESEPAVGSLPQQWDWSVERPDCVSSSGVRDQGDCGSCWAFSAVGQLSDTRCIAGLDSHRVQYSEQYVVNCDSLDYQCNGGTLSNVQYFLTATGTTTNSCQNYTSGESSKAYKCSNKCDNGSTAGLVRSSRYASVCSSEQAIMQALQSGTVQTAFTVYSDFLYYQNGVYQHIKGYEQGGHAVEIVGYGATESIKYWRVKNSWGWSWGENGFFRIVRGRNECEIETECYLMSAQ